MLTAVQGTIRYRLLLNWAADPGAVARRLPPGLRPQLVDGRAVVGVCALHLDHLRPPHVPPPLGLSTTNAAHRVAVEWDGPHGPEAGVWIWRRDTAQRRTAAVAGRLFPGPHGRADFTVDDAPHRLYVGFRTADGYEVEAAATAASTWSSQLFATPAHASSFFERGHRGLSPDRGGRPERVDLISAPWEAEPVDLEARATFFDDVLPAGATRVDSGLLIRDLPVTWRTGPIPGGLRRVPTAERQEVDAKAGESDMAPVPAAGRVGADG